VPAVREILIGYRSGDHALLTVRGRLFPDDDDSDWLWTSLTVRVGGFGCQLEGNIRADELRRFRAALEQLSDATGSEAVLATEDGWVTIALAAAGDQAITGTVRVHDQASPPNELHGTLPTLEPAGLTAPIESLHEIERTYR
jgi:hypothetical protein